MQQDTKQNMETAMQQDMSLLNDLKQHKTALSLVGLGYVGMPIAVAFSEHVKVVGFDINSEKIEMYKSGKDPTKVDRSGAYAARKIAADIVRAGYADKAEVQIAYAIGVAEPVSVHVETFGTEHESSEFLEQFVRETYDLTPRGIIDSLGLLDVDYNLTSSYGHFGKAELPWEK